MILKVNHLSGLGRKLSPWSFKVAAIIPVWKDFQIYKVLTLFDKPYVDEIILIVDEPTSQMRQIINSGLAKTIIPVTLIENERRMGVGYALRQGLQYALKRFYDAVVILAANGKDDPREIPILLKALERGYDYVQGSRFLPGGKSGKLPLLRGIFVRVWPYIWTLFTGKKCTEVTNGFRAYKTEVLKHPEIKIDQEWQDQYALEYYVHYKILLLGYKHIEVPVSKIYLFNNTDGYSKICPYRDWIHIVLPLLLLKMRIKK